MKTLKIIKIVPIKTKKNKINKIRLYLQDNLGNIHKQLFETDRFKDPVNCIQMVGHASGIPEKEEFELFQLLNKKVNGIWEGDMYTILR